MFEVKVVDAAVERRIVGDVFISHGRFESVCTALGIGTLAKLRRAMKALGEQPRDKNTIKAFCEAFQLRVNAHTFFIPVYETWSYPNNGNRGRCRRVSLKQLPLSSASGLAAAHRMLARMSAKNGEKAPLVQENHFLKFGVDADALVSSQRLKFINPSRLSLGIGIPPGGGLINTLVGPGSGVGFLEIKVEKWFRNVSGLNHLHKLLDV